MTRGRFIVGLVIFVLSVSLLLAIVIGAGFRQDAAHLCDILGGTYTGAECVVVYPS